MACARSQWTQFGWDVEASRHNSDEKKISRKNVASLREKWKIEFPNRTSVGSGSIADGVVYFPANYSIVDPLPATFYAVDRKTGHILWQRQTEEAGRVISVTQPVVSRKHGLVYFASSFNETNPQMYALRMEDGSVAWKTTVDTQPFALILGYPGLVEDLLLVPIDSVVVSLIPPPYTTRGAVVALDARTGEIRWRFVTAPEGYAAGSGVSTGFSFDTKRKLVFIGTGQNYDSSKPSSPYSDSVLALRYDTTNPNGELVWSRQFTTGDVFNFEEKGADFDVLSTPIVADILAPTMKRQGEKSVVTCRQLKLILVSDKKGYAYGLNRKTGEILWSQFIVPVNPQIGGFKGCNAQNAYAEGIFYVTGHRPIPPEVSIPDEITIGAVGALSDVYALDAATGTILWKKLGIPGGSVVGMTVANGLLYHATTAGIITIFHAKTGEIVHQFTAPGDDVFQKIILTSLNVAEGTLFFSELDSVSLLRSFGRGGHRTTLSKENLKVLFIGSANK